MYLWLSKFNSLWIKTIIQISYQLIYFKSNWNLHQSYEYATRLDCVIYQLLEDLVKMVVPPITIDGTHHSLPDGDGFFHNSLCPFYFFYWESHTIPIDSMVVVHKKGCQQ